MSRPPKIVAARAIDDRTLLVDFDNQESRQYDITKLLDNPMFAPLRNPAFFKSFTIEPGGYAIVWSGDIDLSEHELWVRGSIP